jgi:hypothetical protein
VTVTVGSAVESTSALRPLEEMYETPGLAGFGPSGGLRVVDGLVEYTNGDTDPNPAGALTNFYADEQLKRKELRP